ncbi:MAG TPA: hypothetical protein VKF81_15800 [Blastocatellia bacterium]|nr:hypothetical protein [Blastocatellia bacterium]
MSQQPPTYSSQQQPPVWASPSPDTKKRMSTGAKVALFGCLGLIVVIVAVIALAIALNWDKIKSGLKADGQARQVIISSDGQYQIQVPTGWKQTTNLHEKAGLQAEDRLHEMYIIVLSESKSDFEDMNLDKHSQITSEQLINNLSSTETSTPTRLVINGNPALQYVVSGTISNVKVTYLHTTVETAKSFNQVLAWTLRSRFEQNRAALQNVAQSFKEAADRASAQ